MLFKQQDYNGLNFFLMFNFAAIILVCKELEESGDCINNLISGSKIPTNISLQNFSFEIFL